MVQDRCFNIVCIHQGGLTALMIASFEGRHECLSILLAHSANVDKANEVSVVVACIEQHGFCSDAIDNSLSCLLTSTEVLLFI